MVTVGDITSFTVEEETSARHKRLATETGHARLSLCLLILRHPHLPPILPTTSGPPETPVSTPTSLGLADPSLVEPLTSVSVAIADVIPTQELDGALQVLESERTDTAPRSAWWVERRSKPGPSREKYLTLCVHWLISSSVKYSYSSHGSVCARGSRESVYWSKAPLGFQAAGCGIRGVRQLRGRVGPTELVRKPSPMT